MSSETVAEPVDGRFDPVVRLEPPIRSPWREIGGAFAASIALHTMVAASLALIVVAPRPGDARLPAESPIAAILVGSLAPPDPTSVASHRMLPSAAAGSADRDLSPGGSGFVQSLAASPAPPSWPWAGTPVAVDAPPSMFGTGMTPEGVDVYETRSLVRLGEAIERKVRADFRREPDHPVVLRSDAAVGYPLDALAAGIEGTVLVWFVVDEEGAVVERVALDGPPELADWTLSRLPRLVERPAHDQGKPVRAWVALEVDFRRDEARR